MQNRFSLNRKGIEKNVEDKNRTIPRIRSHYFVCKNKRSYLHSSLNIMALQEKNTTKEVTILLHEIALN